MFFLDYKENVKRTCPDMGSFNGNPVILNSLHMTVGMFGEIYEVNSAKDNVNLAEEITDILWYACNYANIRAIFVPEICYVSNQEAEQRPMAALFQMAEQAQGTLINAMSELQDYDKKEFAYGKVWGEEIQKRREALILIVFQCLNSLYSINGIEAERAMQNNIDKLKARFPDKFDADKANNRNLDAERTQLEK